MIFMMKALSVRIERVWSYLFACSARVIAGNFARLIVRLSGCDLISMCVVVCGCWVYYGCPQCRVARGEGPIRVDEVCRIPSRMI